MKLLSGILLTFIFSCAALAQGNFMNGLFFSYQMGFAQYQKANTYRTNVNVISAVVGKEFPLSPIYSVVAGAGMHNYFGETFPYSFQNSFVSVPLQFRAYTGEESPRFYAGFGIENKYKFQEIYENLAGNTKVNGEKAYHLGILAEMGYRTRATENLDFLISLNYSQDMLSAGYSFEKQKMLNGVNLSLAVQFYNKKDK